MEFGFFCRQTNFLGFSQVIQNKTVFVIGRLSRTLYRGPKRYKAMVFIISC